MCLFHLLIEFLKKPYLIEYSTKYIYSESSNLQMNNQLPMSYSLCGGIRY